LSGLSVMASSGAAQAEIIYGNNASFGPDAFLRDITIGAGGTSSDGTLVEDLSFDYNPRS
jgi:hypothetical protein